jgi:hypothetical protein
MSKDAVQRSRHLGEVQRVDEQPGISDLPAPAAAHEAPELLLSGPSLPRRLLLEGAEGAKVALSVDHLFHGGGTEGADQLVLQVRDAHIETESFKIGASEVRAEAGALESALELTLLRRVAEARQPDVQSARAEQIEKSSDGLRASHRHDGNFLGGEVPATSRSQRFECALVADPFDEDDSTCRRGGRVTVVRSDLHRSTSLPKRASGQEPLKP